MTIPTIQCAEGPFSSLECDLFAAPVYSDLSLGPGADDIDAALGGGLRPFLEGVGFTGARGETALVPTAGHAFGSAVLVGLGSREEVSLQTLREGAAVAARVSKRARRLGTTIAFAAPPGAKPGAAAAAVAEGAILGSYEFVPYKTSGFPTQLQEVTIAVDGASRSTAEPAVARAVEIARAVVFARDLVNEPSGAKPPREIARRVAMRCTEVGLGCEVWDRPRIEAEKLGGLLGVSSGSGEEPRLARIEYRPADPAGTIALVGKGVTFDSGGLSIKTAESMESMKTDMSGAAAVVAAMTALHAVDCPVRVIGYALFVENMPGGRAVKPGDVLRFRNGKTGEVVNTDAEGRLILADGLSLACEESPDVVIDLATLTGACQIALGGRIAGLFSTDDGLAADLLSAAERAGERLWRLPLPSDYRELIDSPIADMKNSAGRPAGAITGALFLKEFVSEGIPWAHLDIAGPARSESDSFELSKGGTGVGVRTLVAYLTSRGPDRIGPQS
jgi:leucyl aminopeptidase